MTVPSTSPAALPPRRPRRRLRLRGPASGGFRVVYPHLSESSIRVVYPSRLLDPSAHHEAPLAVWAGFPGRHARRLTESSIRVFRDRRCSPGGAPEPGLRGTAPAAAARGDSDTRIDCRRDDLRLGYPDRLGETTRKTRDGARRGRDGTDGKTRIAGPHADN